MPLMPLHKYSLVENQQQANEKRLKLLDEATAYALIENGAEPKDAAKLKRFESLTKDQICYHMNCNARSSGISSQRLRGTGYLSQLAKLGYSLHVAKSHMN